MNSPNHHPDGGPRNGPNNGPRSGPNNGANDGTNSGATTLDKVRGGLARRYRAEKRFRAAGLASIVAGMAFVMLLFGAIISAAAGAFTQTSFTLDVRLDESAFAGHAASPQALQDALANADYRALLNRSLYSLFPEDRTRRDKKALRGLVSSGAAFDLREQVAADPAVIGTAIRFRALADDEADLFYKGKIDRNLPENRRRLSDRQISRLDRLAADGRVERHFSRSLFTRGDSRGPERAGLLGALTGSFFALLVAFLLSFPIGIATAVYLEEFAPRNRLTDFIEVNINNLAAVPSIIFGLLGLAVFLDFFGLPRSSSLVGGIVLALMTLPTVIIAGRAALKAVPPSIREAALAMGASPMQTVLQHTLPLAMPGVLTGAVIGMAQALGESAPLLMIGMVAFIADVPQNFTDPATALPVQVYLWANQAERAFTELAAAATLVLLLFLIAMNLGAVLLRKKFERRW